MYARPKNGLLLLPLLVVILAACGGDKPLVKYVNKAPTIEQLSAATDTVEVQAQVRIECVASDPEEDSLEYVWTVTSGSVLSQSADRSSIRWQAPGTAGRVRVQVAVSDPTHEVVDSTSIVVVRPSGNLSGTVRKASTEVALDSVVVRVAGRADTTGSDGTYRLENLPLGNQSLTATRRGYDSFTVTLANLQEGENSFNFSLTASVPRAIVHGVVRNSRTEPVAGAALSLNSAQVVSGTDGSYRFQDVPYGEHRLTLTAVGYATETRDLVLDSGESIQDFTLNAVPLPSPAPPFATKNEDLSITVEWDALAGEPTLVGYHLYASQDGATFIDVAGLLPPDSLTVAIAGVEHSRYRFFVTAENFEAEEGNPSAFSNVVVLTFPSAMVSVPAGAFIMGDTPDGWGSADHPGNPVSTAAFRIERTEVSNRQFVGYLYEAVSRGDVTFTQNEARLAGHVILNFAASKIDADPARGIFNIVPGYEIHPAAGVTWYGANAYARAVGRRLPTEAEWEKTARGLSGVAGSDPGTGTGYGFEYPWGLAAPDSDHANFDAGAGRTLSVESLPEGVNDYWGQPIYNLAGNVWEWCEDWYGPYRSPHDPPNGGSSKVLRGGSYSDVVGYLRNGARFFADPELGSRTAGFRCADD